MELNNILHGFDLDSIRQSTEAILAEPMFWFPIRHGSPASARHVQAAIRSRRPKLLFLEAPSSALKLVPHISDVKTIPPICLYSSFRDDHNVLGLNGIESPSEEIPARFESWMPLLSFSPEYVAIKEATAVNCEIVFSDLPLEGRIAPLWERVSNSGQVGQLQATWDAPELTRAFVEILCEVSDFRSWEEAWEDLFEAPDRYASPDDFRRSLALFSGALRRTIAPELLRWSGTAKREAFMWRTIRTTLAERRIAPHEAMVVCGGLHMFLPRDEAESAPVFELPQGTSFQTLVAQSNAKVSAMAGASTGARAPAYYELLWSHSRRDPANAASSAAVDHITTVLRLARKQGELLSSADAVSATDHAHRLARMRGRKAPSLDDVRDALIACCCKGAIDGEGRILAGAMSSAEVGIRRGAVTRNLGTLPLVHDFHMQLDALGLEASRETAQVVTLDLRNEDDRRKAAFFHRLTQIGVGYAKPHQVRGADRVVFQQTQAMFRESWSLAWTPSVDAKLTDNNVLGETVESAALAAFESDLFQPGLRVDQIAEQWLRGLRMNVSNVTEKLATRLGAAIDTDSNLSALAHALSFLLLIENSLAQMESTYGIDRLIERCFARACSAIPSAANAPSQEYSAVLSAIRVLAEASALQRTTPLDRELFIETSKTAHRESTVPFFRGAFAGILTELRVQSTEDLAAEIAGFARARPEVLVTFGSFLHGVISSTRTAVVSGAHDLIAAIDGLLRVASWEQFMTLVADARIAFESLPDRTRDVLIEHVADRYSLRGQSRLNEPLETSVGAAVLVAKIDAHVAEIMKHWGG